MPADFIGVVRGMESGRVYAVINPADDSELDNPRMWLFQNYLKEGVHLIRIPRDDYMKCTHILDIERIAAYKFYEDTKNGPGGDPSA